jgi:methanogenic corrinoid protein MtbC1
MTDGETDQSFFHDGLYTKTINEIGTLRRKLPEAAVASLAREVIRRLSDHQVIGAIQVEIPTDRELEDLAEALMTPDAAAGLRFVDQIRAQGASVETVYVAYLSEAAKTLGRWWDEDRVTFVEVTIAIGHVYAIMRSLRPSFYSDSIRPPTKSALFAMVPGDDHSLGVEMAADLFRKNNWDIALQVGLSHDALVDYISASRHDIIGISAGSERSIVPLAKLIVALRISVPKTSILVCGNVVNIAPDVVELMGVDAMPLQVEDALSEADRLWANRNESKS